MHGTGYVGSTLPFARDLTRGAFLDLASDVFTVVDPVELLAACTLLANDQAELVTRARVRGEAASLAV